MKSREIYEVDSIKIKNKNRFLQLLVRNIFEN